MKFNLISLLVGGAGLVAAVPLRLVVVEHFGPVPAPRIGLAGSGAFHGAPEPAAIDLKAIQEPQQKDDIAFNMFVPPPNDPENPFAPALLPVGPKHRGCGGNKAKNIIMAKMDDFSKFFRNLLGFDPIDQPMFLQRQSPPGPGPKMMAAHVESDEDDNEFHILPFMPGPVRGEGFPPPPPGSDDSLDSGPPFPPPGPPEFRGGHHHRMWIHRHRPHSFFRRLHRAFLTLSPWEGRALSFVVGCGIGVLLRMFYVFSVLAYRCFFAQPRLRLEERQEEERTPAADATTEQPPLTQVPPPEYNEKSGSQ